MRFWPHIHRDPNWRQQGCHNYYECRCGARRTDRAFSNLLGPVRAGWPDHRDRHGRDAWSSGWVPEPADGWPKPGPKPAPPKGPATRPAGPSGQTRAKPPPPPPYQPGGLIRAEQVDQLRAARDQLVEAFTGLLAEFGQDVHDERVLDSWSASLTRAEIANYHLLIAPKATDPSTNRGDR